MNRDDNLTGNARYYASPQEQKILVQGLLRYFSLPERSQNRNKVVKEVATYLSMLSPHWSHRAVRLWFNNNRHTYLPSMNEQQTQQNIPINPILNLDIPKIPDKISPFPSISSNINTNLINNPIPNMNMNNLSPQIQQQIQLSSNPIINPPISPNRQNFQMFSMKPSEKMPTTQFYNTDQTNQSQSTNQQPTTPFTNQIFNSNVNFMSQFQFTSQPQNQQSIQVNAPIQFSQQSQFTNTKQQQTTQMQYSPQKISKNSSQTKIQSPIQKVAILNKQQSNSQMEFTTTPETKNLTAQTQQDGNTNNFFNTKHQSNNNNTSNYNNNSNTAGFSNTGNYDNSHNNGFSSNANTYNTFSNTGFSNAGSYGNSNTNSFTNKANTNTNANSSVFSTGSFGNTNTNGFSNAVSYGNSSSNSFTGNMNGFNTNTNASFSDTNNFNSGSFNSDSSRFGPGAGFGAEAGTFGGNRSGFNSGAGFTSFIESGFTSQRGSSGMNNSSSGFGGYSSNQFFFQPDGIQKHDQGSDQVFTQISSMIINIRNQQQQQRTSPHLSQLINEFDRKCMQTAAQNGYIPPEKIESNADYIAFKFPSPTDDNVFPYSNSTNDFSEINDHFGGHESATVWDQMSPNNIWQERPFIDETLTYFENCLLTDKYFGYTSLQFGSSQRSLSLKKFQSDSKNLSVFRINCESMIDSMCINNDVAFLLAKKKVIRINLLNNASQGTINLDSISDNSNFSVSEGFINSFGLNSAIVSFSSHPELFFVNNDLSVSKINTSFSGFINVSAFGFNRNNILVCSSNSPTIRMISPDGVEIGAFVGHLGQVMGVEPLTENIFVSRGSDKTIRIWDYRSPRMISTITAPTTSTLCMTGSRNFVICGFSNKNITVTDIRKFPGKPFLGVSTNDYNAIMMKYDSENDSLMMFGQVEKDTTRDSMIFIDTNGLSRKSILRHYSQFTGVDCN